MKLSMRVPNRTKTHDRDITENEKMNLHGKQKNAPNSTLQYPQNLQHYIDLTNP